MHQHERIVVDVDDPGIRRDRLGDLMGVVGGRQAGTDVQELPDPRFAGQVPDRPAQEYPVGSSVVADAGVELPDLITDLAVDRVVVLAA